MTKAGRFHTLTSSDERCLNLPPRKPDQATVREKEPTIHSPMNGAFGFCPSRPRAPRIVTASCQILASPTNVPKPQGKIAVGAFDQILSDARWI
ncbi:hypothetical protein L596_003841 [Steinernema carpocapsae]|uniref:Uncharacterized protein n=1 Tax=Steinernema carpocapsae TaxID=34508 RepID=A0A4U8UTQ6_STECR|nr:hypothetical protein L596_003841 [Steinernema carpocapsae]